MGTAMNPIFLPITTVQHDFEAVMTDVREGTVPSEDFWISCYHQNKPSIHGKVRAELDEGDRHLVLLEGRDGVHIERGDLVRIGSNLCPAAQTLKANLFFCKALVFRFLSAVEYHENESVHSEQNVRVPKNKSELTDRMSLWRYLYCLLIYPARQPTQITAFDVSPDGSQIATGYDDGTVVFESTSISTRKFQNVTPNVHAAYVSSLRFFPSSRVLLTAGADFTLQVLPAERVEAVVPVSPVRTLKGHTRAVTDTAIVSKGRNVLSSAKVRWAHLMIQLVVWLDDDVLS